MYRNFASLEDFEGEIALLRALPSNANQVTPAAQVRQVLTPEKSATLNQKTGK